MIILFNDQNVLIALLMTLIAGLSTGIGSLIAFFAKETNTRFLSISLGFSAGVMIYVSMIEIYSEATEVLTGALGLRKGSWITALAFFGGIIIIGIIDRFVPEPEAPEMIEGEQPLDIDQLEPGDQRLSDLKRTGMFTALAIAIHNFPEGIATFISALKDPKLAIPIVVAIAIHNIPEGIAVSVPIYYSTGSRKKAFWYSFLSGLAEPLGALVAYLVLMPFLNDVVFGVIFAGVAGIMVFISLNELLPSAFEYDASNLPIYGCFVGMAIMALSLLLFL